MPPFGAPQRYYSSYDARSAGSGHPENEVTKGLAALLADAYPDLQSRVSRSFRQWNNVLREQLRNEMGLRLSVGEDVQTVQVKIVPGFPKAFQDAMNGVPPGAWRFLLHLPTLESTHVGLKSLIDLYSGLNPEYIPDEIPKALPHDVIEVEAFCQGLLDALHRLNIRRKLGEIREDVLGAYFFNLKSIELYWMVLGLVAGILGVSVESLTVVVATHELAHAYSHLGRDIDGTTWDTPDFAAADLDIVEGIAQFYTETVSLKLQSRNPELVRTFRELLGIQKGPYVVHQNWTRQPNDKKDSPVLDAGEIVRSTLLQCRRRGVRSYPEMEAVIASTANQLRARG